MKTRIISGLIGVIVLIFVMLSDIIVFDIAITIISVIAILELYKAVKIERFKSLKVLGVISAVLFSTALIYGGTALMLFTYVYIFVLFMLLMTRTENIKYKHISKAFFATVFVLFFFGHLAMLRRMDNGHFIIWFVLIISFLTDTFAYFSGMFLGKHKLAPALSPKKTVEGSVGGLVGAVIGMLVYCLILKNVWAFELNAVNAVIVAVLCSVISQIGDLAASAVKRQYEIKDYGNIMPGHGGIMDRFDGVLFTAPAVYYLIILFPIILR